MTEKWWGVVVSGGAGGAGGDENHGKDGDTRTDKETVIWFLVPDRNRVCYCKRE
jgi:hypothetical protein